MTKYEPGSRGQCPHCRTVVRFEGVTGRLENGGGMGLPSVVAIPAASDLGGQLLRMRLVLCPACGNAIISLEEVKAQGQGGMPPFMATKDEVLVWPRRASRPPVPKEVPPGIDADYEEAALVLADSPKASAALSRRCLQSVLRDQGFSQYDLADQIDAALPKLPAHVAETIDLVRHSGNFAAHAKRDVTTGDLVEVTHEEAEWNLDVLDEFFDLYYVQPERNKQKRAAMNAKIQAAGGTHPMK